MMRFHEAIYRFTTNFLVGQSTKIKMTVFTMIFVIAECIHFPSGLKSDRLYALYIYTHLRTSLLISYLATVLYNKCTLC